MGFCINEASRTFSSTHQFFVFSLVYVALKCFRFFCRDEFFALPIYRLALCFWIVPKKSRSPSQVITLSNNSELLPVFLKRSAQMFILDSFCLVVRSFRPFLRKLYANWIIHAKSNGHFVCLFLRLRQEFGYLPFLRINLQIFWMLLSFIDVEDCPGRGSPSVVSLAS